MNFRKLLTYLTVSTAAVIPFAGAQNPTILQGSYISNVFGNSNFVLNPNGQTNVANVTNATRSTTTPLVATSEFTLALASGANATWTLRAFDSGMKGQNCEARFSYRGFATATTKAEIVQNSLVVAHLVLTPSTDPRIASINFPCGDLVNATTFRIAQTTANMTIVTPNEIGGIYVGLATNMANVAQAQAIFRANDTNGAGILSGTATTVVFPATIFDSDGGYNASTGVYTIRKAGRYLIHARVAFLFVNPWPAGIDNYIIVQKNSNNVASGFWSIPSYAGYQNPQITTVVDFAVGDTVNIQVVHGTGGTRTLLGSSALWSDFTLSRFPSASELVVTPERQNTWGGVRYYGSALSTVVRSGSAASTTYSTFNNSTWSSNRTLQGKCAAPTSSGDDIGCSIANMPVGSYKIEAKGLMFPILGGTTAQTVCSFELYETTTTTSVHNGTMNKEGSGGINYETTSIGGVFTNTSLATRNFVMRGAKTADNSAGNLGQCALYYSNAGSDLSAFQIIITPLDQPSNSALYVQGPVLGAQTGAAIPASYVGEVKESTFGSGGTNLPTTNGNTFDVNTLDLTPGVWLVTANFNGTDTGQTTDAYIHHYLFDSTNSVELGQKNQPLGTGNPAAYSATANFSPKASSSTITAYVKVTSNITIKNRIKRISANGGSGYVNGDICKIIAIRLN